MHFVLSISVDGVYSVNEMDFTALHRYHDRRQRPCREDRKAQCLTNRIVFSANRRTINWNYLPLALHLVGQRPHSSLLLALSVRRRIHRIALAPVPDWGLFTLVAERWRAPTSFPLPIDLRQPVPSLGLFRLTKWFVVSMLSWRRNDRGKRMVLWDRGTLNRTSFGT